MLFVRASNDLLDENIAVFSSCNGKQTNTKGRHVRCCMMMSEFFWRIFCWVSFLRGCFSLWCIFLGCLRLGCLRLFFLISGWPSFVLFSSALSYKVLLTV